MDTLKDTLLEIGLASMGRGAESPTMGLNGAVSGNVEGNSFPKRSYCIAELPNGGCTVVNPPDQDDDRMEARR